MKNKRPHNKHTPYKLEISDREYVGNEAGARFVVRNMNDEIVEES